jgi:hypothetical protein
MAITMKNYRKASTYALEAKLDELEGLPMSEWHLLTEAELEAEEELSDAISAELAERELEASLPGAEDARDSAVEIGSYAS